MEKSDQAQIFNYVVQNLDYLKTLLVPLKEKRETLLKTKSSSYTEEIEKQYLDRAKWILTSDVCKNTGSNTEDVLIFFESMNLKELL